MSPYSFFKVQQFDEILLTLYIIIKEYCTQEIQVWCSEVFSAGKHFRPIQCFFSSIMCMKWLTFHCSWLKQCYFHLSLQNYLLESKFKVFNNCCYIQILTVQFTWREGFTLVNAVDDTIVTHCRLIWSTRHSKLYHNFPFKDWFSLICTGYTIIQ